ncbi:BON domain-containing protein [Burkholderia catarinensis]|uniref:BON domain-containing protein n=1 Tax=Burkholderia catarinensis TaxID=1108140 RepID=UPI003556F5DE
MSGTTLPTAIYGHYQHYDGLTSTVVSMIYAAYAVGVLSALLCCFLYLVDASQETCGYPGYACVAQESESNYSMNSLTVSTRMYRREKGLGGGGLVCLKDSPPGTEHAPTAKSPAASGDRQSDHVIAQEVRSALVKEALLTTSNVFVVVRQGHVSLEGPVPETTQIPLVDRAASSAPGAFRWRTT